MRVAVVCIAAALLVACHHRQPKMSDALLAQLRAAEPGITDDCLEKMKWGGIGAAPQATDKCFKMLPAIRWRGLWRNDFEGSDFCPAPADECRWTTPRNAIWLSLRKSSLYYSMEGRGGLYAVDFVGRRTAERGHYGHMGTSDYEVIVDRLISIRQVEPPPQPPKKADVVKRWKACEAAGTCKPDWQAINSMKD